MTAWKPTDQELLSTLGVDAVVFMRIFVFSVKVFSVAGFIGIFILLPINYLGSQLEIDISDFTNLPNQSIESFSIANVNNGSKWLWVHFSAIYVFSGAVCYFLYTEFGYISSIRVEHYNSTPPQPHQFSVLVRGIPVSPESSCSDTVENFFKENHPSTYLSHAVVRRTRELQSLIRDANAMYNKISNLKLKDLPEQRFVREGLLGIFGPKVDVLFKYEEKLKEMEENVRKEQASLIEKEVPAAFVSFKTRLGAAVALHIQQGINPTEWITERAPEPQEIHWPFFTTSFVQRWLCQLVVFVATVALIILFLIPVVLVQGLTHLDELKALFPFLKDILDVAIIGQVITGYLPSLILYLFQSLVPPIMMLFSSMQGFISTSQTELTACNKVLMFTVWNVFFANVLSGSFLDQVNVLLEPKEIPHVLAQAVPVQAAFFISYVVTSGWTTLSSELCRLKPLLYYSLGRLCSGESSSEVEAPSIPYHAEIPTILLFGLLGVTYFFLSPLILPFVLVYFCFGYIIFRNQVMNVYYPKYESVGKFWPIVHYSTIFSLVLMQTIAIGVFGLKKVSSAATWTIPLPILTLLFNEYCRKRFMSMFKDYPLECLAKKDQEEQGTASMHEFHDKLVTAYQHPSLSARFSRSRDDLHSPLLPRSASA